MLEAQVPSAFKPMAVSGNVCRCICGDFPEEGLATACITLILDDIFNSFNVQAAKSWPIVANNQWETLQMFLVARTLRTGPRPLGSGRSCHVLRAAVRSVVFPAGPVMSRHCHKRRPSKKVGCEGKPRALLRPYPAQS